MAANDVFMDTAGFLALWDAADAHHQRALRLQSELARKGRRFLTTDYVVGDVEIESVGASSLDLDIFGVWTKGLEFGGEVERDFGLVGAAEDLGFEGAPPKLSQVFGLNVLEIDKYDVGFHVAGDQFGLMVGAAWWPDNVNQVLAKGQGRRKWIED
jgi:hypothetical protein